MIELERHIEILLLSNDCVIVPGFGGFTAHYMEARYVESEQLFLPPLRTIGFNPQLTMNDSLLALSYVEAYDISYPEALRRIESDVRELKQRLDEEGRYELNYIGTLHLNEEGHCEFEPGEAGILTPGLYGLSSFEFPRLAVSPAIAVPQTAEEETKEHQAEIERTATERSATKSAPVIAPQLQPENASETESQTSEDHEEKTISIRVSLLRDLAIAACVILAFLLFPAHLSKNDPQTIQSGRIDTGLLYRILPKDVTTGHLSAPLIKPEENGKKDANAQKETTQSTAGQADTVAEKPFFSIVLASRVTCKNAQNYVAQLHREGYKEAGVLRRNKGAKVIFGHYDTENEAYTQLRSLRRHSEFAEAWVMLIK